MDESWHTCERVVTHIWMSHVTHIQWESYGWVMAHTWTHHHTYEWVMSRTSSSIVWMSHVKHVNKSWHTHGWVMSRTRNSRGSCESARPEQSYAWVMSHMWTSHVPHLHIWMSHVTHQKHYGVSGKRTSRIIRCMSRVTDMNKSRHTYLFMNESCHAPGTVGGLMKAHV